jgi:hypothetical protein
MSFISDLTPLNLREEKTKFFQNFSYNPQFSYRRQFTQDELTQWGSPQAELYHHAQEVIEQNPLIYDPDKQVVSQADVVEAVDQLLEKLGLMGQLAVEFEENRITRCGITNSAIKFRLPLTYSDSQLVGVLHHEIETHLLRKINNTQQPWATQPRPDHLFRTTEEGLAKLHSFLDADDKVMRLTFYAYIAVYLSQSKSFAQVFEELTQLGLKPEKAWFVTIIAKRGLTDTSQAGGITKTITYIEGALRVLKWLADESNDPHQLYWGRIDLDEITSFSSDVKTDQLIFPTFFDDIGQYRGKISAISKANGLDKFL